MTKFFTTELLDTDSVSQTVSFTCEFDIAYFDDALFNAHSIARYADLSKAVVKRRSEYLAGRYAAKRALEHLGDFDTNVSVGENRSPMWPRGVVGSISHTNYRAISVVSSSDDNDYIGIDIEQRIKPKTVAEISPSIINLRERRLLEASKIPFATAFTTVFSAKESLFKAIYPEVREFFDFKAAELVLFDPKAHVFDLVLTENLSTRTPRGTVFHGRYEESGNSICTQIIGSYA